MQKIEKTKERLDKFLKYINISQDKFAKNVGLSKGFVNNVGDSIRENNLKKIIAIYPELNINWLKTGEGEMLKNENQALIKSNNGIPLIPIDAMAGFATGEIQVLEYECERYIVPIFKDAEFLISVRGNSMYPKYSSGDLVACKKLPLNDLFFQWNKVYVLDTIQGALVKRIKKGSDDEHILIISDNESYEPFELHKSQINAVALVVGVLRLE